MWDDALTDVRIAVATYAVLQDALSHAFVTIESIGLIVFDEGQSGCLPPPTFISC